MRIERDSLEDLLFGSVGARRFTQDSPLLPDVWLRYGQQDLRHGEPVDLLFTPHRQVSAGELAAALIERVRSGRSAPAWRDRHPEAESPGFAYNQTTVVARLHFEELIRAAVPLSPWWRDYARGRDGVAPPPDFDTAEVRETLVEALAQTLERGGEGLPPPGPPPARPGWQPAAEFLWYVRLVGAMAAAGEEDDPGSPDGRRETFRRIAADSLAVTDAFCRVLGNTEGPMEGPPLLFLVNVNRVATPTVSRSVMAIKADAGRLLFKVRCAGINWAILDSGIDATHPAFRRRPAEGEDAAAGASGHGGPGSHGSPGTAPERASRVRATYDFTRVRHLLNPDVEVADERLAELEKLIPGASGERRARLEQERAFWTGLAGDRRALATAAKRLREGLESGRSIDWSALVPFLQVPHGDGGYIRPAHDHGTHVAGILGADWQPEDGVDSLGRGTDELLEGVCPDINLYDLRVLDDRGYGDEFSVMAALQFIRFLNANRDTPLIHGVNLSLAIPHDVANYACGRTPVCLEAERLVASGVIVVAAAGNEGYVQYQTPSGSSEGYRSISITDPGNAQTVLTVGATHRYQPHTYGVSYFSSRGPTGDGRMKPDLVAPGEKITSTTPDGLQVKDGTSMAAPHVSGAAAMLIARYREMVGDPVRVKQVLCDTATDLGRERYFQGSGMLDVLRALQHI